MKRTLSMVILGLGICLVSNVSAMESGQYQDPFEALCKGDVGSEDVSGRQ